MKLQDLLDKDCIYEIVFFALPSRIMASTSPPDSNKSRESADYAPSQSKEKMGPCSKEKPTLVDGLKSIHPSDFTQVHKTPCARESFLTGMGAGFAVGGVRLIFRGKSYNFCVSLSVIAAVFHGWATLRDISYAQCSNHHDLPGNPWTSMTYAIFSFSLASAGAHTFCQRRRKLEQDSMARAEEIVAKKREERAFKVAEMKAERQRRREEHEKQKGAWGRMTAWLGSRSRENDKGDKSGGSGA